MNLKRDMSNAKLFGVCAGLAKHLNADVTLVRLVTALSFLLTGSVTFWAYVIAAIVLPTEE